jgi:hypothetical protein
MCGCNKCKSSQQTSNGSNSNHSNNNGSNGRFLGYGSNYSNNSSNNVPCCGEQYICCNGYLICYGGADPCQINCCCNNNYNNNNLCNSTQLSVVFNPTPETSPIGGSGVGTTVTTNGSFSTTYNYYIYSGTPTTNIGPSDPLYIGNGTTSYYITPGGCYGYVVKVITTYTFITNSTTTGTISWVLGYKSPTNVIDLYSLSPCVYADVTGTGNYACYTGKIKLAPQAGASLAAGGYINGTIMLKNNSCGCSCGCNNNCYSGGGTYGYI